MANQDMIAVPRELIDTLGEQIDLLSDVINDTFGAGSPPDDMSKSKHMADRFRYVRTELRHVIQELQIRSSVAKG